MEKETEGAYCKNHWVKMDVVITDDNGCVLFAGCETHGKGFNNNLSYKESSMHDFNGLNPSRA